MPLVIYADQKAAYLDALEAADAEDVARFVRFVADRAVDVVRAVEVELSALPSMSPEAEAELGSELQLRLQNTAEEAHASLIRDAWCEALEFALAEQPVNAPLTASVHLDLEAAMPIPSSDRPGPGVVYLIGAVAGLTEVVNVSFGVMIRPEPGDGFTVTTLDRRVCDVLVRDVTPTMSQAFLTRLRVLARSERSRLVAQLVQVAHHARP